MGSGGGLARFDVGRAKESCIHAPGFESFPLVEARRKEGEASCACPLFGRRGRGKAFALWEREQADREERFVHMCLLPLEA